MSCPITIDCHYMGPRRAAAYLLREGDEAAFIEANTARALPRLLDALAAAGMRPEQVRWIAVTHVHLDHAGGAAALMAACPDATLLCHPRATRHLVDPGRLVAGARAVYGDETFERLYGSVEPVEAARVRAMEDEERLAWGGRELTFMHTRGHADHHVCVHDSATGAVFTGDAFGLRYDALRPGGLYVLPSTSPTGFRPEEARQSVRRIAERGRRAWLTHFGGVDALEEAAGQLLAHLDFAEALAREAAGSDVPDEGLATWCEPRVWERVETELGGLGAAQRRVLELDVGLNAQGIAWRARKLR